MFYNEFDELTVVPKECFGAILSVTMIDAGIETYREFHRMLEKAGITDITAKRISEYCKGIYTPSFLKAKQMLNVLDYSITDNDLIASLNANKEYAKMRPKSYRRKGDKEIRISVRLKLSKIMPKQDVDRVSLIMDERIEHLCGSKNNYTEYIQALIAKDLDEYILSKESIKNVREDAKK